MSELRPDTLAVRGGLVRSGFDETSEGLFMTSGYVYASAQEAEAATGQSSAGAPFTQNDLSFLRSLRIAVAGEEEDAAQHDTE